MKWRSAGCGTSSRSDDELRLERLHCGQDWRDFSSHLSCTAHSFSRWLDRLLSESATTSVVTVRLIPATPIPPRTSDPGPSTRSSRLPDAEEFQKHESDVASVMTRSHSPTAGSPRTGSGSSAATSERNTLHPEKIDAVAPSSRPAQDQVNLAPQPRSFYLGQLAERLSRVKQYPIAALARRETGVVLLSMRLDRLGRLLSSHIAASSGYSDLDNEVSAMAAEAAPFPPFPALWNRQVQTFWFRSCSA